MSLKGYILRFVLINVIITLNCFAVEPPSLLEMVEAGEIGAMQNRLPEQPYISDHEHFEEAQYGGTLKTLFAKSKDIRMMVVYGYARLVGYDDNFNLKADILHSFEVEEGRIFTFHLRKGHKWSDGYPFTSEAFSYYWEDIVGNKGLSPFGPPKALIVDGELPKFEVLDELTVRYTWSNPNPLFLAKLAEPRPMFIYAPAHYLKQFHERYTPADELVAKVAESGRRNWVSLHHFHDRPYKSDNPLFPVLQPWMNTTKKPAERFIFKRNPWFHRVDKKGWQLPYIDQVAVQIVDKSLVAAKAGAGESDLQGRNLQLTDYTFLKESEERHDFNVFLWQKGTGSQIAIYPNLNSSDLVWRKLARDVTFRRALTMGINRHEINQVVYYGLATESNNTVLSSCPLFKPQYQTTWIKFDPKLANKMLDEIGLNKRNEEGIRIMSDGRPLEIILHTAGESTEETDVLELIKDSWLTLGIKLFTNPSQREVFRERVFSGHAMMAVSKGVDNGNPTAIMSPEEFAPVNQTQLQWPKWGQYYETKGKVGEAPDIAEAKQLFDLYQQWQQTPSDQRKEDIWHEMLQISSDQVFSIGLVCGVLQPIVVSERLKGVPEKGIYSWSPTSFFGIYHPDSFWLEKK